jgi:cytochrome c
MIVWDARTLERWLADPEKLIPGQRMGYSVAEAADRADLVECLRLESKR